MIDLSPTTAAAYADALRRVVTPGAHVLDLGGDFGRSAVLACRLGAARVYSLQAPHAVATVEAVARANGYAAQIECIEHLDDLGHHVDVVMTSALDDLPLHGLSLLSEPVVRDQVRHGAVPVPRGERLMTAIVNAPELYRRHSGVWDVDRHLDLSVARQCTLNAWSLGRVEPSQVLCELREWGTLDHTMSETAIAGRVAWTVAKAGCAHGLVVWSETTLAAGVVLANDPCAGGAPHGDAFFPWLEPVNLEEGDEVTAILRADSLGTANVWTWASSVRRAGREIAAFRQSTFFSSPLTFRS